MKKSTLLSLLTATSIAVTTAGTYAAWDSVEASTTEKITFRKPVTVTVNPEYTLTESEGSLGTLPTASCNDIKFTVSNPGDLAKTLKIVPEVTGSNGVSASDFVFTISDTTGGLTKINPSDSSKGFTDNTLDSTSYTVTVTPKDDTGSISKIQSAGELTINLKATLE